MIHFRSLLPLVGARSPVLSVSITSSVTSLISSSDILTKHQKILSLRHHVPRRFFFPSSYAPSTSKWEGSCEYLKISTPRPGVLLVILSRPSKLNAVSAPMMVELKSVLASAVLDQDIGCVVLTAEGVAFCVGSDIKGGPLGRDENSCG